MSDHAKADRAKAEHTKIDTTETEYGNIRIERRGAVATVTFSRPERANALNHAHLADIEAAALAFRDDAATRVVIFTGAGKHFSSGADLGSAPPARGDGAKRDDADAQRDRSQTGLLMQRRTARMGERATLAVYNMDQITIAAWNGAAMGGGAVLATAMDFRIGGAGCFMQYPEIDIGVNLMWKGLPLLVHLAGPAAAKRLVIGGVRVHAEELQSLGILDQLVADDELADAAMEWALHYAAKPPIPAQMIKQNVNAIVSALDRAVMHGDVDQNLLATRTEDRDEAIRAYRDKSEPTFKGD